MLNLKYYNKLFLSFRNNGIEYNIMHIDVRTNEDNRLTRSYNNNELTTYIIHFVI